MSKLTKTILGALVGMGIGYVMSLITTTSMSGGAWMMLLGFAGIPSGWRYVTKLSLVPMTLMGICIHFILSMVVGWISLPIELFVGIREAMAKKKTH